MPKPSVGVVQREADDQDRGEADLAGAGRHADGQALGEVVQADRRGDRHARAQRPAAGQVGLAIEEGRLR